MTAPVSLTLPWEVAERRHALTGEPPVAQGRVLRLPPYGALWLQG